MSVLSFSCHPFRLAMLASLVALPTALLLSSFLIITKNLESEETPALCKTHSSFRVFLSPSLHKSSPSLLIKSHCSLAWLLSLLVQGKRKLHSVITPLSYSPSSTLCPCSSRSLPSLPNLYGLWNPAQGKHSSPHRF